MNTRHQDGNTWVHPDFDSTSLIQEDARRRGEPWALWSRKGICICISDVAELPQEDLVILADDMRSDIAAINDLITAERAKLSSSPAHLPSLAAESSVMIRRLSVKKNSTKLIMLEARRAIGVLSKGKKQKRGGRKQEEHGTREKVEHISHQELQGMIQHLKRREMRSLLKVEVGEARYNELESRAIRQAATSLREWATSRNLPSRVTEHVIGTQLRLSITHG